MHVAGCGGWDIGESVTQKEYIMMVMSGRMLCNGARSFLQRWTQLSGERLVDPKPNLGLTSSLRRQTPTYDGDNMSESLPKLGKDEKEHITVYHDEAAFHANDFQQDFYLREGEHVLKKKDRGRLIMTSGFICQHYGNLALTEELKVANEQMPEGLQLEVTDSRVTICPTSKEGGDSYWNMEQMITQVRTSTL